MTGAARIVNDSLYLAVALTEGSTLVTADRRLAAGLRGTGLDQVVELL